MSWMDDLRRLLGRAREEAPPPAPCEDVTCQEALERVFEWLDGELDPELESRVGEHLRVCAGCYPVLNFEQAFREALRRAPADTAPPSDLRQQILSSLESAGLDPD